jgi:competence protein ComEC
MSFGAVAALVAMAEAARPHMTGFYTDAGWIKRGALGLAGMLMTSLVASLATAPYSLFHFQQVASYSVLANALSVPISGLMIMPMVIISYALLPFGAADWSLKILGLGVDWLLDIARGTQGLSGSVMTTPAMPDIFLILMTVTGFILILFKGWGRMVSALPFCVAMMSIWTMDRPDMIVSNDGGVMAVNDTHHVYLSSARKDKFASTTWLKRWGKKNDDVVIFPKQGQINFENGGSISCDPLACRIDMKGIKVSFGDGIYELKQDCGWANVIVSDVRLPKDLCPEQNIQQFGYYDFENKGAISIFAGNSPRIQDVGQDRGIRPWSQSYQSKTYKETKDD